MFIPKCTAKIKFEYKIMPQLMLCLLQERLSLLENKSAINLFVYS